MNVARGLMNVPNPEQAKAIEAPGVVFVSAGAGTGKTTVLVERFVKAVCDVGLDVDSLLVITYTERAAGELRDRIRSRLAETGRDDLARELDAAWISTIHGFCHRLLKAHPFAAGLDPRFRVLDESQARVLQREAFDDALTRFCADGDPERLGLLATYGARALRRMIAGVHETLRAAGRPLVLELGAGPGLAERVDELREAARALAEDADAGQTATATAARALEVLEERTLPERLLDLGDLRARGERAATYEEARRAVEQAALDELAGRDRDLLQELLESFGSAYRAAKDRESALDFEDLQLAARDLLRDDAAVREQESWRFRSIMVDEFQDTNRLQCEIVDLLAQGPEEKELFFVGDEFQSIYRFRHADVEVFRERREQTGGVLALTQNYRSRPEVLAAVNHLFTSEFGEGFQPLEAAGRFPDPVFGTPVELLVTDKASYAEAPVHWRRAEARHIAARVKQLVDSGEATAGEIVLLFAAGTDAEWYEEELRQAGLRTHRATGRGYFGQQQVVDLLAYLRLLHNRYDDEALVTVLASPLVGLSNDALVLLRRAAPKRPLFLPFERGLPADLDDRDRHLCRAFLQRYERLVRAARELSLEQLCERIVADHDYDLAVLAQWDGRRRYANLRKLARLARSYEELRGRDVEGFVRFVREQEAVGARELEAVAEEEGGDAVRLLTIHAAKGLEFKVVIVADAGRDRTTSSPDEILCLPDGRFGFRVADPATGSRRPAFEYERVREAEREAERAERLRLYYVAMTRAIDRLIVSGAIDPSRAAEAGTPIGWVLSRLDARELDAAGDGPLELVRDGTRLLVRVDRHRPDVDLAPPPAVPTLADDAQLELFVGEDLTPIPPPAPKLPDLSPIPAPPLHAVRRLSYSALALFERCSYRYYAERVAGMRPDDAHASADGQDGLAATEIGDAVHRLLELVDLATHEPPAVEVVRDWYPAVGDEELERIGRFVASYCDSDLARRVAALRGASPERPFAFEHDGVLLHGRLDVYWSDGETALVLDYKTNSLAEGTPEEIVEEDYRLQRAVYALVCLRAGAREVEVVYHFLERGDAVVSTSFGREDVPRLEAELAAAIERIREGDFRPTPSEFTCAGCPALDRVCAGPRLLVAEEPAVYAEA
jgi:ATP-dependent exoDNAse (exonuclease V) beta subunit